MNRHVPTTRQVTPDELRHFARIVTLRDGRRKTSYRRETYD